MERYKWIRSEQEHRDVGQEALREWIHRYAKQFRDEWEQKNGKLEDVRECNHSGSGRLP